MITFCLASSSDIPLVMALYSAAASTPGCTWNEYYPSMREISYDVPHGCLYIMKLDGRPVGAASLGDFGDYSSASWARYPVPCELARVAILPQFSGRSLATLLVSEMIKEARVRGWKSIRLLAAVHNPAALALYEHFGFVRRALVSEWGNDYYAYERNLERT